MAKTVCSVVCDLGFWTAAFRIFGRSVYTTHTTYLEPSNMLKGRGRSFTNYVLYGQEKGNSFRNHTLYEWKKEEFQQACPIWTVKEGVLASTPHMGRRESFSNHALHEREKKEFQKPCLI